MPQPDLISLLRESRPIAPPEVREHVRQIAAQAGSPRRVRGAFTWRRALLVAVPAAAAAAGALLLLPGASRRPSPAVVAAGPPSRLHGSLPLVQQRALTPSLAAGGARASGSAASPAPETG